ncbi:hypothetical protein RUESEDTHA_03601 [Ruegeria sp. THAF57]|uniref:hypothetical protein n=1 Tax=Ruegeria sp. THAF57 TaxID=2744555 RepID=UPI0015DD989D|nr:hypothetical protein [Ruegeria sp. THAF57]CAD0186691.1 hypothetical protein RUESEDTHA_03601 [Ruegeria sp. THAF57]
MLKKIEKWAEIMIARGFKRWQSPQAMMQAARQAHQPHEKMQAPRRQTRYSYENGPMYYLGQQIVKAMQDAGYPAKISECYRSPERQSKLRKEGFSKARAYQSPHQYYEAVDIIHPSLGWNVSQEYWDTLATCARIVADRYGVEFDGGFKWGWDLAHIELEDWRTFRAKVRSNVLMEGEARPPTKAELGERFQEVLPQQWRRKPWPC